VIAHGAQRLTLHHLHRARDHVLPRGDAEAAADHDQLRLEDVREGAHAGAEVAADLGEDRARGLVAFVREADEPVRVGGRAERLLRGGRGGKPGDVRLEVSAPAAHALTRPGRRGRSPRGRARRRRPWSRGTGGPPLITPPPSPVPIVSITRSSTPRPSRASSPPFGTGSGGIRRSSSTATRSCIGRDFGALDPLIDRKVAEAVAANAASASR